VLFEKRVWDGLRSGAITVALRRWKRPTVKAGGTLQSPGGLLAIDAVEPIDPHEVTARDAEATGYETVADALAKVRPDGQLYRVRFHRIGDDPRVSLREQAVFEDAELAKLERLVERNEWARLVLQVIADNPAVVSTTLAAHLGMERLQFKQRVRVLKAHGLTESLETGYRLSPRGAAFLVRLR
jgi:hypothetical protein